MTSRERLGATLRGEPVDRPAVNFYEIGGFLVDPANPDPYNIYNAPDWQPLLRLAEEQTDLIRMCGPRLTPRPGNCWGEFGKSEAWEEGASRYTRTTLRVGGRTLTSLARRDREVDTIWMVEHLLKDAADLEAYLELPDAALDHDVDVSPVLAVEAKLGDRGLVMVDTGDPICAAAALFSMADYTVIAFSEPALFHRLLAKLARPLHARTAATAAALPGRLWRIYGPEYATAPYLPPSLFEEYVVRYTLPMVQMIQRHGGVARIHCHGRLRGVLPHLAAMGADALDPLEPPPQGDVPLAELRRDYGRQFVLFGNLEISEIETTPPPAFARRVEQALRDGTAGAGRGFVLMPSAAPYGRVISPTTLANYETMVRLAQAWGG